MKERKPLLLLLFLQSILLVGFQNCAKGFAPLEDPSLQTSSADVLCESTDQANFGLTYWPVLKTACAGCHVPSGFAPAGFGASDLASAFQGFNITTKEKILANGTNPQHGGGAGGPKNQVAIQDAQTKFEKCKASLGPSQPAGPMARTGRILLNATETARVVTVNLDSQLEVGSRNFGGAQLLFSVRRAVISGTNVYLISNPSLRTGTSSIQVKSIRVLINQRTDPSWTAFSLVDRTLNPQTEPQTGQTLNGNLAVGTGTYNVSQFLATDEIQLEFEILKVP